ncbi:MAG: hypothetical protein ACI9DC_002483 [Gammaproteobacteria bacterium]|jgi:hypothetical protein
MDVLRPLGPAIAGRLAEDFLGEFDEVRDVAKPLSAAMAEFE